MITRYPIYNANGGRGGQVKLHMMVSLMDKSLKSSWCALVVASPDTLSMIIECCTTRLKEADRRC